MLGLVARASRLSPRRAAGFHRSHRIERSGARLTRPSGSTIVGRPSENRPAAGGGTTGNSFGWPQAIVKLKQAHDGNPDLTLEDLIRRTINRVEQERSLHVHVEAEPVVDILTETLGKLRSSLETLESFDSEQEQIGSEQEQIGN